VTESLGMEYESFGLGTTNFRSLWHGFVKFVGTSEKANVG
jgi:hypothetical protein